MAGCQGNAESTKESNTIKVATYNLSFDRDSFETLLAEMQIEPEKQNELVSGYFNNSINVNDRSIAEKVIQIRNVAAIIQKNRPDVLMMAEFNNDGGGQDKAALEGFQKNYLSVAQSINGAGEQSNLDPITYPYFESYSTNTGLNSQLDLNNDGTTGQLPGDSWGFGQYHGQYAFALLSRYKIDSDHTRTFQTFKWKDMEGAKIPTITVCDGSISLPKDMSCGDNWYTDEEWQQVRLSSKNHVDAPIIIPTKNGDKTIHLLMSHPTPPVFDSGKNKLQNGAEVAFWLHYIRGESFFYDDNGLKGGLEKGAKFVIMGDQNLDPLAGDGLSEIMHDLHNDPLVNQTVMNDSLYPTSNGSAEHAANISSSHPKPDRMTSTFGLGVDYTIPSANLKVIQSGVYWPASYEQGYPLVNDQRLGEQGNGKKVSSDHRLVWITISK
ncbi:succinyl-CoA synthetase subunit alpha [Vibrio sagamiensis NBRC 104589]|uniref:Succinyl-CoA synthetase subunit alpha n=1 Tax=Vibrio sagamiensis NBRC 104589 TaxID=1219064 RepID=A0A511QCG4_9VIBR|nr:succinyl-CoA synthetase subunit alpha [Vibrio sagamiensis NBRC 104589]